MTDNNCLINIGKFAITSGKVMISDPCYEVGTGGQGILENVKNGTWNAFVSRGTKGGWGVRNAELIVLHENHHFRFPNDLHCFHVNFGIEIDVDSGQAGIFDFELYPKGDFTGEYGEKGTFYDDCCNGTLDTQYHSDIIWGMGVVSSSGFGDGSYNCLTIVDDNQKVIAIRLVFIDNDEEDLG